MLKASPFPTAPKRKQHRASRYIDPDHLQIADDEIVCRRSSPEGKYDLLFSKMKPGQCIKCEPDETQRLSNALRTWIKRRRKAHQFEVRSVARYTTDQRGRVWLLPKDSAKAA